MAYIQVHFGTQLFMAGWIIGALTYWSTFGLRNHTFVPKLGMVARWEVARIQKLVSVSSSMYRRIYSTMYVLAPMGKNPCHKFCPKIEIKT